MINHLHTIITLLSTNYLFVSKHSINYLITRLYTNNKAYNLLSYNVF